MLFLKVRDGIEMTTMRLLKCSSGFRGLVGIFLSARYVVPPLMVTIRGYDFMVMILRALRVLRALGIP